MITTHYREAQARRSISIFVSGLIIACMFILFLPGSSRSQNSDTPFGVTLSMANAPDSTLDDLINTLVLAKTVGSHGSFIWKWAEQDTLNEYLLQIWLMKQFGLKSFPQMSIGLLGMPKPPSGLAPTFADPATKAKYLENVIMIASMKPTYMNIAAEANFIHFWANEEWEHFKDAYREAYDIVKNISPDTMVGVSFHYDLFVWQQHFTLFDELGPHDFVAFSSYPGTLVDSGHYASLEDIPVEWYSISRLVYPDKPIIFSEIAWSSEGTGTPEEQMQFIEALPSLLADVDPELVTWAFLHDTDHFQPYMIDHLSERERLIIEQYSVDMPMLFKRFNGMGLRLLDGTPKPSWFKAMELDFNNVQ